MIDERQAYIALNMMERMGPVRARKLREALGSAAAVFEAAETDLVRVPGIGKDLAAGILSGRDQVDPEQECKDAARHGWEILTPLDEAYPAPLHELHDPPLALYVWGTLEKRDKHAIAMVGSRRTSNYGKQAADRLAFGLAKTGFTVVSGLARGIDTAAHVGALKGGGRTIAVIGAALDKLYPPENAELAEKISRQGAVLSEYPLGREADKTTFPYRNRLVCGLSMGVLVVEAPRKSGALHTADLALDNGKPVFAVPGRIDSPTARGTNNLIKQGARLVDDVDDVIQEYEYLVSMEETRKPETIPAMELSERERIVAEALLEGELEMDTLLRATGLSVAELSPVLLTLEMKRVIRTLPGRMIALAVEAESLAVQDGR